MRMLLALCAALLVGCATPVRPLAVEPLFDDARYGRLPQPGAAELFALSPAMQQFLLHELRQPLRQHGTQMGLYRALSEGGHLRLDYEASRTRTAAEAFAARQGNCLSLVLMTAAFARDLGLSVHYQLVEVPELWTRSEQFTLLNGHVNLSLGDAPSRTGMRSHEMGRLTIDFQPFEDPRLVRVRPLAEDSLVAMFHNNRAVEAMEEQRWAEAHGALRAALAADPQHLNALNTLAVLHRRNGDLARAEAALRLLLERAPANRNAAANLVAVLEEAGRKEEAAALARSLPPSPFADYERGQALAAAGKWQAALNAFERQLRVAPDFHGLHLELARMHAQLGHTKEAQRYLQQALDEAPTARLRQRYQAKLNALRG